MFIFVTVWGHFCTIFGFMGTFFELIVFAQSEVVKYIYFQTNQL